uniref:RNA polymerase beta subunit n=1 Tax=Macrostomum lignano TaxID=282301 RepID=A0A1I8GPP9_9PLAT
CRGSGEGGSVLERQAGNDGLVEAGDLVGQLVHGLVLLLHSGPLDHQHLSLLVDLANDEVVQDAGHDEGLDLGLVDVELRRDEGDADASVGLNEAAQHLRADVAQQLLDVLPDEGVLHDGRPVLPEQLLKAVDVVGMVGGHQAGHGGDLGVVAVGLGLLTVQRVDAHLAQHAGEHQVLQALDAARAAGLVVVFERLEEVGVRLLELGLAQVHLAAALANDAHDERVRDGRLDVQRLVVQVLQLLVVLLQGVHLDLQGEDLQQVGLEPQPVVLRLLERVQRGVVEVEQQVVLLGGAHVVQDGVNGLLRVVAGHSLFDVRQQLFVQPHHLVEPAEPEVDLHHLLERLEAPVALLCALQVEHLLVLLERQLRILVLQSLGVVVLVLQLHVGVLRGRVEVQLVHVAEVVIVAVHGSARTLWNAAWIGAGATCKSTITNVWR